MSRAVDDTTLRQLFLYARTHNKWQARDVPDSLLHQLVDVLKMGPTSANCSPARFVFVKSKEAKERLKAHLSEGNRDKTMQAPRLSDPGSAPAWLRLRAHVWLRQRRRRPGLFRRHQPAVEFSVQHRLRRPSRRAAALVTVYFRRDGEDRLKPRPACGRCGELDVCCV
jgi:nitroreductase